MKQSLAPPETSQHEELRFLVKLILFFAVVAGAILLVPAMRGRFTSKLTRVQLKDGTWMVVRGITVGKNHSMEIPDSTNYQFKYGQRTQPETLTTQTNRMVIWLSHENERGEVLDLDWFRNCELVIQNDYHIQSSSFRKMQRERMSSSSASTGYGGFTSAIPYGDKLRFLEKCYVQCEFPVMRPRDGGMRIAVFDGKNEIVTVLEVPYPDLPTPVEDWVPDKLPSMKSDGDLEVTLSGIKYSRHPNQSGFFVQPQLSFAHDGKAAKHWRSSAQISDAVGNSSYEWNCELSPFEPAWKVSLTLSQSPEGQFLDSERKKVPLKSSPVPQKFTLLSETHEVNGTSVSLIGIAGQGPVTFQLPGSTSTFKTDTTRGGSGGIGMSSSCTGNKCEVVFTSYHPFLMTSSNSGTDTAVEFILRDQSGEVLKQYGGTGAQGMMFWFFQPLKTTTSIEVEIIAQKQRHVEFIVAPPNREVGNQNP